MDENHRENYVAVKPFNTDIFSGFKTMLSVRSMSQQEMLDLLSQINEDSVIVWRDQIIGEIDDE